VIYNWWSVHPVVVPHVSLLSFFRLGEIVCNIYDIDQGPRVIIAPLDRSLPPEIPPPHVGI
jgi:hypothetical protein